MSAPREVVGMAFPIAFSEPLDELVPLFVPVDDEVEPAVVPVEVGTVVAVAPEPGVPKTPRLLVGLKSSW